MYYSKCYKRVFDVCFSLMVIIILIPIFLTILLLLIFANRGNPFFLQERPGWKERPFKVIKFKTMNDQKDEKGNLLPNHSRITKVGSILRKSSLDEIPQLFNVLIGDMSLVGPRPLLFKYIPLYSKEQRRRHETRPGITGWAQVNGRNAISWTKKFDLDIYYVDNISFCLDLKILWLTFQKVFQSEGINLSEVITSEPFNGKN